MKKSFLLMISFALLNLLLPASTNAQSSCCLTKPSCQVVSCAPEAAKVEVKTASLVTAKKQVNVQEASLVSLASSLVSGLNISSSFVAQLGMVLSKLSAGGTSNSACLPADCDPTDCNPSNCDLSKCVKK